MSYPIDTTTYDKAKKYPLEHGYDLRVGAPTALVVHSTEGGIGQSLQSAADYIYTSAKVSAHYLIGRAGEIIQFLDTRTYSAWHAGASRSGFNNQHSIGIENLHANGEPWPPEQKDALAWLCKQLIVMYHIPIALVETHGQIAIKGPYSRKHDPTNWSHDAFVLWRLGLYAPTPRGYRVAGLPVYQRSDRTGPLWGILPTNEPVVIDDPTNGHLQDGRGFVDMQGLV